MRNWIVLLGAICIISLAAFCATLIQPSDPNINGLCFVAPSKEVNDAWAGPVKEIKANFVAIIPYAFAKKGTANIIYNTGHQWWGEAPEGAAITIQQAHKNGLQVMLKPQIWISGGGWIGDVNFSTEEDWKTWESSFEKYILEYADIAESNQVAIFCMGTELKSFVKHRPLFWKQLIAKVKRKYHGKLTYSANWDNYQNIPFWKEMDYIGISAYFPLLADSTPEINALLKAWQPIQSDLAAMSKEYKKKILFTEYGYRNIDQAAWRSWEYEYKRYDEQHLNHLAQVNAYQALYKTCWYQNWCAGGFIWKWYHYDEKMDSKNTDWSPQNKPVEAVIKAWYGKIGEN